MQGTRTGAVNAAPVDARLAERVVKWKRERVLLYAVALGSVLALVVSLPVSQAANLPEITFVAFPLMIITVMIASFQDCPRCGQHWNTARGFSSSLPYSSACRRCGLPAPALGPVSRGFRVAMVSLFFAPSVLVAAAAVWLLFG